MLSLLWCWWCWWWCWWWYQIWVPSEFQRDIFTRHGVNHSKLQVVGEAVDAAFFDPDATDAFDIGSSTNVLEQPTARGGSGVDDSPPFTDQTVVLFSVFKWEPRKAPDLLMKAYVQWLHDLQWLTRGRWRCVARRATRDVLDIFVVGEI